MVFLLIGVERGDNKAARVRRSSYSIPGRFVRRIYLDRRARLGTPPRKAICSILV